MDLQNLPKEQRQWFIDYKKAADRLKKDLNMPHYNALKVIGLEDDIPTALCLIATMKPGVHEASQKLMSEDFGIEMKDGQIPLHEMNDSKHKKAKSAFEIVEKIIINSIITCTEIMAEKVEKNGFVEVNFCL